MLSALLGAQFAGGRLWDLSLPNQVTQFPIINLLLLFSAEHWLLQGPYSRKSPSKLQRTSHASYCV